MELSVRILVTIILTMAVMHLATIFFLLYHKEAFCRHAQKVTSWLSAGEIPKNAQRVNTSIRPVTDINMHPRGFDDMFGVVTGIEAIDETYSLN
jgi:hypothetical protein